MNYYPKIIALDFQNAKLENLENWLNTSNSISDENAKYYIRKTVSFWNDYENPIDKIYFINDVHFAIIRKRT